MAATPGLFQVQTNLASHFFSKVINDADGDDMILEESSERSATALKMFEGSSPKVDKLHKTHSQVI